MSEEGEGTEEARKVSVSEKEGNNPDLSGEEIVESVRSPEEEDKLNTPVPAPHIITSSSPYPPFLAHVSNLATDISMVSEMVALKSSIMVQRRRSNGIKEVSIHLPL